VIALFRPYSYSFPPQKRFLSTNVAAGDNQRIQTFYSVGFLGSLYNSLESFLFIDSVTPSFRTDCLLRSIQQFFNTAGMPYNHNDAYLKYAGSNYPKLSVFAKINIVENRQDMGRIFQSADFTGDMLFTEKEDIFKKTNNIPSELIQSQHYSLFKNTDERLPADIKVEGFSFNELRLQVNVDNNSQGYCFLYYSDAYHPYWNAYVNGKKTPVIKTNIGYKSILIPCGASEVVFRFGNLFYIFSVGSTLLLNICILFGVIYVFITELIRQSVSELEE
jgi:hypothetical protein